MQAFFRHSDLGETRGRVLLREPQLRGDLQLEVMQAHGLSALPRKRGAAIGAAFETIENRNRDRRASEPSWLISVVQNLGGHVTVLATEAEGRETLELGGLNIDFRLLDGLLRAEPIGAFYEGGLLEAIGEVTRVNATHLEISQGQATRRI